MTNDQLLKYFLPEDSLRLTRIKLNVTQKYFEKLSGFNLMLCFEYFLQYKNNIFISVKSKIKEGINYRCILSVFKNYKNSTSFLL